MLGKNENVFLDLCAEQFESAEAFADHLTALGFLPAEATAAWIAGVSPDYGQSVVPEETVVFIRKEV